MRNYFSPLLVGFKKKNMVGDVKMYYSEKDFDVIEKITKKMKELGIRRYKNGDFELEIK